MQWTGRAEGHLGYGEGVERRPDGAEGASHAQTAGPVTVEQRRARVVDLPWMWVHQVHGAGVVVVAGDERPGQDGDGLVTARRGVALAVFTADCAPVALASPEGVIGVAHAGWRGLVAGIVPATVDAMRALGASSVSAALGPCIRASCYEFGARDLARVVATLGGGVEGRTAWGTHALDLGGGVAAALESCGADLAFDCGVCTACDPDYFSYRAGADANRQATVVWRA